jgi:hypothetical protein
LRIRAIQEPVFLWLIQILKAVAMIMITAIAFFWSYMGNPAMAVLHLSELKWPLRNRFRSKMVTNGYISSDY